MERGCHQLHFVFALPIIFPNCTKIVENSIFVLDLNMMIQFVILYKALRGWINILFLSNEFIPFDLLHKSFSGWITNIQSNAFSTQVADQMSTQCLQFQREIVRLREQLMALETQNGNMRSEKERWLVERSKLIDSQVILKTKLEKADAEKADEIHKLVEKIEKEKSRMITSYAYFDGLSTTFQQKEDEWNAERTQMAAQIITEQINCVKELKAADERYQSTIEQKEQEHKAHVNRMRREFERKMKGKK